VTPEEVGKNSGESSKEDYQAGKRADAEFGKRISKELKL